MDESEILKNTIVRLETELNQKNLELEQFQQQSQKLNFQIQEIIEKLQKDIDLARRLYRLLVPTEIPNISGFEFSTRFEPSMISGGDYYDIFELQDRFNFGVILSSASVHTMSSLFMFLLLSQNAKTEGLKGQKVDGFVRNLSKNLVEAASYESGLSKDEELNLVYCVVDRRRFIFEYVILGQALAYHLPYGENEPVEMTSAFGPLSIRETQQISSSEIVLNPRDKIVLASLGFLENRDGEGQGFGRERFRKILLQSYSKSAHDLRHDLLYGLKTHLANREIERDVTIVVLEVQDRVVKLAR